MQNVRKIITDPDSIRRAIREKTLEAVRAKFPVEGKQFSAQLENVTIKPITLSHGRQREILMTKGNASEGVYVTLSVHDRNGRTVCRMENHRILNLPWYTNRYTLILDGNEYAIVNQMRTKAGVYTRKRGNSEIESSFNLSRGANFKLIMDPATGMFKVDILGATVSAFALLHILGATRQDLVHAIGEDLADKNATVSDAQFSRTATTLFDKLVRHSSLLGDKATLAEKEEQLRKYFSGTKIDPETTRITLGIGYETVSAQTLLNAMRKILEIYKGEGDVDERDNLEFQHIFSVEDLLKEVIDKAPDIVGKIKAKLDGIKAGETGDALHQQLKSAFSPVYFTKPIHRFITSSSLSRLPAQINPMEFLDTASIITRLGEGAISSERAVPFDTRGVHHSYLGLIDPIAAPESFKVGIDVHCTYGAMRGDDHEFYKRVVNCRTGRTENIRAIDLYDKHLGFPDPLYTKGKHKPEDVVPAVLRNKLVKVPRRQLDYQLSSPHDMVTVTTNSLPFMNANQGNRLLMGDKHIQQALPLKEPETRLVKARMSNTSAGGMTQAVGSWTLPKSPVDGTVKEITEYAIRIEDTQGIVHDVDYENNLPLASKTFLHNTVTVRAGDAVKAGQVLADSNFSRNGELTMGRNLTVAYMPYNGMNHEDGVVLSETAAKKLTSVHAVKVMLTLEKNLTIGKERYAGAFPTAFSMEQLSKLDTDGVVRKGEHLENGDPIVLSLESNADSRRNQVLGLLHKSLVQPYRDAAEVYEEHFSGEVVAVQKSTGLISVVLRVEKPLQLGDKLAGSYGNKGVCSKILSDGAMPHDEAGQPVDAVFTSAGVISRINPAQILESALGKVAKKTGRPYEIENFSQADYVAFVRDELKKNNVKDKETLRDPVTGKTIPGVFVGVQHCHKLFKTTDTNFAARGIEGPHDQDDAPVGSGLVGPKAIGGMEVNALFSHNARALLREGTVLRSGKNLEFWKAFQQGHTPNFPAEKKTFSRFMDILKQAGINVFRKGDALVAGPLTDRDILELSSGEITDGRMLRAKTLQPEPDGLFDPVVTGGLSGTRWSHVTLAEPVLNPVFADAARTMLRLSTAGLEGFIETEGGNSLRKKLNAVDVPKELQSEEEQLASGTLTRGKLDVAVKRVKYLRALKDLGLSPGDAYTLSVAPITPPVVRPITVGKSGDTMDNDANILYRDLILQNNSFKKILEAGLGEEDVRANRRALYTRMKELTGIMAPASPHLRNRNVKGALDFIAGDVPKEGYFQRKVIYGKMNLSGRATISPDVTLGLDEIGLPEDMAWEMYKPFVLRELAGIGFSPLRAKETVESREPIAKKILLEELEKRPVVTNRAPTLWRHGIMSAKPLLRPGSNLQVNSLWEKSLNADYDGDAMQLHVPVSDEAIADALKMLPSQQLFSDKKPGDLLEMPTREPIIGLYKVTENVGKPSAGKPVYRFDTADEAWESYYAGKLKMTDFVEIMH